MSKESFKQNKDIGNQPGYNPNETVEDFWRKMQIEKEERLHKKKYKPASEEKKIESSGEYGPTSKEQETIKILTAPISDQIDNLKKEVSEIIIRKEKIRLNGKIGALYKKLGQIKSPQQMSKDDIKKLLFKASLQRDALEKNSSTDNLSKIKLLEKEIDFLLDQLSKRLN